MLALRDHTVWNCHDVGLKVCSTLVTVVKRS